MSTPQGPRDSGTNRGRGRTRGTFRTRGGRNEVIEDQQSNRRAPQLTRGSDWPPRQTRNAPPKQNEGRSSKLRPKEAGPSPRPRNHSQKPSRTSPAPPMKPQDASWRNPVEEPTGSYQKHMSDLYQTLKKNREQERKDAIKNGTLADPDKPTSLVNAITTVGTCQDMCPEFERVERIVQIMVDGAEKTTSSSNAKVPDEKHMVKRFRRSAAGYDEQLPSDIRPPRVLQTTLNYLFDEVIGGSELAIVHKFVWDRTRSIRNDFSIQRVTKLDDLKIAIDCFERIARFHILSLHQLSRQDQENGEFDHHQEREQLNNTLLSLMYYYDDSRPRLTSANEAEFRAYCIIFEIQDQRPDLEDRVQSWPRSLINDGRVQTALKIYATAGNSSDEQGPLRPRTSFSIAQANSGGFWALVKSKAVPYVMACVAEIYFNFIRSTALETIWTAYKGKRPGRQPQDWVLDDLTPALGFDNEDQTRAFCEDHGFSVLEKESGEAFVELGSVTGRYLPDFNPRRKQIFSQTLVESKRLGRTLPAVVNGLSVSEAQAQGLVQDPAETISSSGSNPESLFITGQSDDDTKTEALEADTSKPKDGFTNQTAGLNPIAQPFVPSPTIFGTPSSKPNPFAKVGMGIFGQPTPLISSSQPSDSSPILKSNRPNLSGSNPFDQPPKFNFRPDRATSDDSSTSPPNKTPPASSLAQEYKPLEDLPRPIFKIPALFQTDPKAQDELIKPSNKPTSTPPSPKTVGSLPQVSLAPNAQSTEPSTPHFQWPEPPETTKIATATAPFFQWPEPRAATQASQSDRKLESVSEPPKSPKTQETSSPSIFLSEPPTTEESSSPFTFLNEPPIPPMPSTTENSKPPSPLSALNDSSPPADPSKLSGHSGPPLSTPKLSQHAHIEHATDSSKNLQELTPKLTRAQQLQSLPVPKNSPFAPTKTPAEQAKVNPPKPDPRPAVLEDLTNSLMMDENGLFLQFVEFTLSSVVKTAFHQVKDERSWERAGEVRAILLSRKYFKKWKKIAWGRGLRRGREERRKLAQSMREMARNSPQQQEDLGGSLLVYESGRGRQETDLMAPPLRNKRKSLPDDLDLRSQQTTETPLTKKQRRDERIQEAQLFTSRRIENHHNRSRTLETPISLSRARGHSNSFSSFHPDFSHLGNGSISSHSMLQKVRHLVPSVKTDTTRTDYFLLKSRGIDSNTTLVPRTNRKRQRDEPQPDGIKIRKPSPPDAHSHALVPRTNRKRPSDERQPEGIKIRKPSPPDAQSHALVPRTNRKRPSDERQPDGIKIRKPSPPDAHSHAPGKTSANSVKLSTSNPSRTNSTNNARPLTPAAATNSSTNDVQLSKSAPAAPANDDYDSDEALFAQVRAIRQAMKEDIAWYRAECKNSRLSAGTSSGSSQKKKGQISPRKETEKQRRLREFKSTPSRTEQRLKATKANGLLPENWGGFGDMRAMKANTKAARTPERATAQPLILEDENIDITDWEGDEETSEEYEDEAGFDQDGGFSNSINGNGAKGSSFEDAIEL